jgi:hypothetical protein
VCEGRPRIEIRVIPRTLAIDAREAALGSALVAVDGKNSFNILIGLASIQVTYALLHLREIPRFINPRSKGIASA